MAEQKQEQFGKAPELEKVAAPGKAEEKKPAQVEKVPSKEMQGKIYPEIVQDWRTGKEIPAIVIEFAHPFDEYEEPIRVTIKQNALRGKFEYLCRKRLAEIEENHIPVTGKVELIEFYDKKERRPGAYAAIEVNSIFDDGTLYAYIRDEAVRGAFNMMAKEQLTVTPSKKTA